MRGIIKRAIRLFDFFTRSFAKSNYDILIINQFDDYKKLMPHLDHKRIKVIDYSYTNIFKVAYYIRRSNVICVDNINLVIASLNDIKAPVVQIWHASSAVKKFALQTKLTTNQRNERITELSKYDYITANSKFMENVYKEAFNVNSSNILKIGCLQSTELFLIKPLNTDFKYIVYVPTFRDDNSKVIKFISDFKSNEYKLLYSLHPKVEANIKNEFAVRVDNNDIRKYFSNASLVISDYSSLLIDGAMMCSSVVMYGYDYDQYEREQGLNVTKDFFGKFIGFEEELIEYIEQNQYKVHDCDKIRKEFFTYDDQHSAKRIAEFITGIN